MGSYCERFAGIPDVNNMHTLLQNLYSVSGAQKWQKYKHTNLWHSQINNLFYCGQKKVSYRSHNQRDTDISMSYVTTAGQG